MTKPPKKPKANSAQNVEAKPETLLAIMARLSKSIKIPTVEIPTARLRNADNSDAGAVEILGWTQQIRQAVPSLILQLEVWDDSVSNNDEILSAELVTIRGLGFVTSREERLNLIGPSSYTTRDGYKWLLTPTKDEGGIEVYRPNKKRPMLQCQDKMPFFAFTPPGWLAVLQEDEASQTQMVRKGAGTVSPELPQARHSFDFRSVHWYGRDFSFTEMQAPIVEILWSASENGTPDVGITSLLESVGAASSRMSDLFRLNPAWGTLIVDGATRGTKRLAPPPSA